MPDLRRLYRKSAEEFGRLVDAIGDDDWSRSTPCSEWDVKALVNHLVYESLWAPELMGGKTVEEVGDRYDGDMVGTDPKGAWRAAIAAALASSEPADALDRIVHLSFGDFPGGEYVGQLTTDLAIHSWDLAKGIGADAIIDAALLDFVWDMWSSREEMVRGAGVFGSEVEVAHDADLQTRVLAFFGRRSDWSA